MNAFLTVLKKHEIGMHALQRERLTTLQLNMGDLCNQACAHCHIKASLKGKKVMSRKVVDRILTFLKANKMKTLDITGGAPELNPHFEYLVEAARPLVGELIVRSNLTVLLEKGKEHLPEFFRANKVHLICSLPCYTKENVDQQRGAGVFEKSIRALNLLNRKGFAGSKDLQLDLVYNPLGADLPGAQEALKADYTKALEANYGLSFNRLLTITNVPIKRFGASLKAGNKLEEYSQLLEDNFNPGTLATLMCRTFLSVGHDGRLYDCDFNLALGYALRDAGGACLDIGTLSPAELEGREITTGGHCLACTAGSGSGCQGALTGVSACPQAKNGKDRKESVKDYYGKVLKTKKDLKTSACCSTDTFPEPVKAILKNIEPEILTKFYGCGSPIPPLLEGRKVLDLGSGTGRDVYIVSSLAGETGFSTGIDMTDEQLEIAERHKAAQMKRFGFKRCNVAFKKGYIEDLKTAGIEDASQDVVISNCVINLSPDKRQVFAEIFRVLKPGGELYFSDVFADRRVPEDVKNDPVLYGECLGGALYIEDFRRLLREAGCPDYRVVAGRKLSVSDPRLAAALGNIVFCSLTIRAFKLEGLEDICEDYGQVAYYLGTIPYHQHQFPLDDHHLFIAHKPMLVCGNTASMLTNTRYGKHFKVTGNTAVHFGTFPCGPAPQKDGGTGGGGSCC